MDHYPRGAVQHGSNNTISQSQISEWGDQMNRQRDKAEDKTRLNQNKISRTNSYNMLAKTINISSINIRRERLNG